MTINQTVQVNIFGMGPYTATVLGFSNVNGDNRITVRTRFGVCKIFESEVVA